ncbi:MAG: UvrD-helicase domain-containing protein [Spirochaetaceae bacterium]|nr:UvrD-helicase domain-containing protein [Spirochaetaceae bacterium]
MTKRDLENALNGPQIEAVTNIDGPMLIIAGAGSGKTRVITWRIAWMLDRGIPQSAILALTFTNKAAREMEERVKELTGKKLQNLTVSTFHAFGVKILREEIALLGYRSNFSIYDESDRRELIKESLRECRLSPDGADLYALGQLFSDVKEGRRRWDGAGKEAANPEFERVYEEYQKSLKIFNALDFDDLLMLPLELFEKFPETLQKYRARCRYIMVDEFQDTSLSQYRLARLLSNGNICVVGDDDQSIYSWRGANFENILMFERDFPGTRVIKLEQNYRSTTTILEAANGVISNNTNRKEKTLWSGNGGGKPVELCFPEHESAEGDFIAGKIHELCVRERLTYDDFGILIRTNALTRSIEEALLAQNIPYRVSGGQSFFQRKEIKDIISLLRVIANHDDEVNLLRVINTPRRGIGRGTVAALSALARKNHSGLWEAMQRFCDEGSVGQAALFDAEEGGPVSASALSGIKASVAAFTALIGEERTAFLRDGGTGGEENSGAGSPGTAKRRRTLSEKVRALVDRVDYWSYLVSEHSKNEKIARWKFLNIESLIRSIETWERDPDNPDTGLYAWLNRISLITRDDREDEEKGKVNLMTIHASKGLEFPVVFIAGAEDGIIPHSRALDDGGEEDGALLPLEEERRLFYVAITRAREKLIISSCRARRRMQSTGECTPSPFLEEIPPHLVEETEADRVLNEADTDAVFARLKSRFGM